MTESKDPLLFEQRDAVRVLTINDAPFNLMSLEFMDVLEEEVERIRKDEEHSS